VHKASLAEFITKIAVVVVVAECNEWTNKMWRHVALIWVTCCCRMQRMNEQNVTPCSSHMSDLLLQNANEWMNKMWHHVALIWVTWQNHILTHCCSTGVGWVQGHQTWVPHGSQFYFCFFLGGTRLNGSIGS
jgi:hypothetical protein